MGERYEELCRMAKEKAAELEKVKKTSPSQMWLHDLDNLEAIIDDMWTKDAEEDPKASKSKRGRAANPGKGQKRRRSKDEEEGDAGGGEDDEAGPGLVDPMDNPFGDISRWTAASLKGPG